MTPAILHINDNNLLIQHGGKISRTQGYAWLRGADVCFDLDGQHKAVNNCRLEPQQINSLYWQQCEKTAIAGNDCGMRHAADLIWQHLSALKEAHSLDDVVFIVPSHYQKTNLQLLLGIAKACGLNSRGLVNKAVYALHQSTDKDANYLHIDMQLHQTVCSEVLVKGGQASLGKIEVLHELGLQTIQDDLLRTIQNRYIQSDRFDPLHHADTEQQLFDLLPSLATELARSGKANISVERGGQQHVTSIDSKQWGETLDRYSRQLRELIVESPVDVRCYDFNGFDAVMEVAAGDIDLPSPGESSAITLSALVNNQGGELRYVTELDCLNVGVVARHVVAEDTQVSAAESKLAPQIQPQAGKARISNGHDTTATHLLLSGIAVPIEQAQIELSNAQLSIQTAPQTNLQQLLSARKLIIVNDAERKELRTGDRLGSDFADGVITAIRVIE